MEKSLVKLTLLIIEPRYFNDYNLRLFEYIPVHLRFSIHL